MRKRNCNVVNFTSEEQHVNCRNEISSGRHTFLRTYCNVFLLHMLPRSITFTRPQAGTYQAATSILCDPWSPLMRTYINMRNSHVLFCFASHKSIMKVFDSVQFSCGRTRKLYGQLIHVCKATKCSNPLKDPSEWKRCVLLSCDRSCRI